MFHVYMPVPLATKMVMSKTNWHTLKYILYYKVKASELVPAIITAIFGFILPLNELRMIIVTCPQWGIQILNLGQRDHWYAVDSLN